MLELIEVVERLNRLLEPERFDDYCVNGLQIEASRTETETALGIDPGSSRHAFSCAHSGQASPSRSPPRSYPHIVHPIDGRFGRNVRANS